MLLIYTFTNIYVLWFLDIVAELLLNFVEPVGFHGCSPLPEGDFGPSFRRSYKNDPRNQGSRFFQVTL